MMNFLRRYAMAILCGLAALGFGAGALLSAGLVERLFWMLACVLNAAMLGSFWTFERAFPQLQLLGELLKELEHGYSFKLKGRTWVLHADEAGPGDDEPPAKTGEEGPER